MCLQPNAVYPVVYTRTKTRAARQVLGRDRVVQRGQSPRGPLMHAPLLCHTTCDLGAPFSLYGLKGETAARASNSGPPQQAL